LKGWTATVSGFASNGAIAKTIRRYLPPLAFRESIMKTRFILFRQAGVFYTEDTATGKQTGLCTKNETDVKSLLNARNEAMAPCSNHCK
jgi:hypothetical protein